MSCSSLETVLSWSPSRHVTWRPRLQRSAALTAITRAPVSPSLIALLRAPVPRLPWFPPHYHAPLRHGGRTSSKCESFCACCICVLHFPLLLPRQAEVLGCNAERRTSCFTSSLISSPHIYDRSAWRASPFLPPSDRRKYCYIYVCLVTHTCTT